MLDSVKYSLPAVFFMIVASFYGCSGGQSSSTDSPSQYNPSYAPAFYSINSTVSDGNVVISWNKETGASYNLYWAQTSPVTKAINDGVFNNITTSFFNHSGLINDSTYYYVITKVTAFESAESSEISAVPSTPSGSGFSVSGLVKYEDKEYDQTGFTGDAYFKAVRYATVELVTPGGVIASGFTNSSGNFSFSNISATASSAYIRVLSETSPTTAPPVVVMHTLSKAVYSVGAADFIPLTDSHTNALISIPASGNGGGAFNILDVLTYSGEFTKNYDGTGPPLLNAYWYSGSGNGTYYCNIASSPCPNGKGIYVLGGDGSGGGDTDEYDDDVIIHEYGHFAADTYSRDDSPGGTHYLDYLDLDLRLAWSEGWATFFVSAVKTWLDSSRPDLISSSGIAPLSQYCRYAGDESSDSI